METFKILKIKGSSVQITEDSVASEVPFTLLVDNEELATLLCTPLDLEDFTIGFLFTSGLIHNASDIKNITIDRERWIGHVELVNPQQFKEMTFKRLYTSGCGRGILFYNPLDIMYRSKVSSGKSVKASYVSDLIVQFQKNSRLYLATGGTHSAAIANSKDLIVFREDIGRHNAIDKAAGYMKTKGIPFSDTILITSGRISSEVLFKTRRCGIAIVVSKSAPTNQAVRHAQEMDITLIGFMRGARMNIYSAAQRIEIDCNKNKIYQNR